ncbi:MAG TPA: ATP-binding protein [Burkholderiaceae bacterium]|nr:ATP-binding protein [Burkholderiaceae bacterium]
MSPTEQARKAADRTVRRRWAWLAASVFMLALAMVLMFMLTTATDNRALYEANYARLLAVNVLVALVLLAIIVWAMLRLVARFRRKKFGSRLLAKIAGVFALVGMLPGLLIYGVSYQFVSRSIESWFDVRVEAALSGGVNLGRIAIDTLAADLTTKTRLAAGQLAAVSDNAAPLAIDRLREQLSATDVQLWNASGQLLASAGESRFVLNPERPSSSFLRQLRLQRAVTTTEGLEDQLGSEKATRSPSDQARIRVWVPVNSQGFGLVAEPRFLQVVQLLPEVLVSNALSVQAANREYQERALVREGLKRMYIGTLTLALFLSVFSAVLLAAVFGNQLVRPLLMLAEGVRDVAKGDLSPKLAMSSRDELGSLTRSFADMTQQLADTRQALDASITQVDSARANLQTILDNLTAGVVVLDEMGRIDSINPGATRILRMPLAQHIHQPLAEVPGLAVLAQGVLQQFDQIAPDPSDGVVTRHGDTWQQSFEWGSEGVDDPFGGSITIIARGAHLPQGKRLVVFDDVSELVSAQRAKAWGEVARRLAHEIKNPLTPIQLSAERLAMKLDGKLEGADKALLTKSVKTIVDQVDAMKRLVNEFRDYARLPAADLHAVDLNALVIEIMALYEQAAVPVRIDLSPDCPPIRADAQQVRQVIHNLVQNAQDATGEGGGIVTIKTRPGSTGQRVRLIVVDEGPGFAEHILKRAFEPYVTTKARGTGLGLAVVKKIVDEHGARIELGNRLFEDRVLGGQVTVSFAVAN